MEGGLTSIAGFSVSVVDFVFLRFLCGVLHDLQIPMEHIPKLFQQAFPGLVQVSVMA